MYAPTDILIRKTADGDTLWVAQRLVVELCGIGDTHSRKNRTIYKQSLPASWARLAEQAEFFLGDSGKSWRWGFKGGQYYYAYDRIPDRAPRNYRSMLPPKEELIEAVEQKNSRNARERDAQVRRGLIQANASKKRENKKEESNDHGLIRRVRLYWIYLEPLQLSGRKYSSVVYY